MSEALDIQDAPTKRRRSSEHTFQAWVDRLLDRIVLPPMFTTGIDHAATDMQHVGRRAALQGRGVKFGIPDVFVAQAYTSAVPRCAWFELKRGSTVTRTQEAVHAAMQRAGQHICVARCMADIVIFLRDLDFALHQNADNIAAEYEERVKAAEVAPAKKRASGKPRVEKPTSGRIARLRKAGAWRRPNG